MSVIVSVTVIISKPLTTSEQGKAWSNRQETYIWWGWVSAEEASGKGGKEKSF